MQKYLFSFICLLVFGTKIVAQDSTVQKEAETLDTAAIMQDLMSLLDSANNPTSYALVSVGISNRLFSLHNKQLNAKQATTSTLVYSPTVGYFHKSGFSLSAGANFLNDKKDGFGATQYSITPAFDLLGSKNWGAGISYSRYFISDKYSVYASPVQNDLYAYASYKKHWIEPGVAIGYSTGNFTEVKKFTIQATGNTFTDTGTYKIKSFSLIASISHDFEWNKLFGNADGLSFTPVLQINFASDSTQGVSHTIGQNLIRFLSRRGKLAKLQGGNSFQAQSVALSLDLNYAVGNFTILPQLYLDYYLPKTDEKRFTQTFTLAVGYSF
jgi:hypothetical protein